jgi:copper transport protein
VRRGALIASAVVLVVLAGAQDAFAHAILQESKPANGEVLRQSPAEVSLRFNEAVETAFGSIRVYDCGGKRVDSGKIARPNERSVSVGIEGNLPRGTYTATWRVISADAHPVAGAFTFSVGSAKQSGSCKKVFGAATPGSVNTLFKAARAFDFALILLVVGGAVALALVLRSAAGELRAWLYTILAVLAAALVVAGALCLVLQGAVAGGFGLGEAFRWRTVDAVLETRFGKAFLIQIGLAAAATVLATAAIRVRSVVLGALVLIPALGLLPTLSDAGHARTSGSFAFLTDLVHLTAASIWVGGLAFMLLALLRAGNDRWPLAARAVPVFSLLAVVSVVTLIAAGVIRGYEEIRAWHGLWDTTYGRLLLAKIALVLPLLALGAYNNRYAVPRLKRQIASVLEQRRFLRAAGVEVAIMAIVLGVTAVLVTEPPAKASIKAPKLFNTTAPIGNLEVNVTIEPARAAVPNVMHLYFFTQQGVPANTADTKLSARLSGSTVGPLRIPLQRIVGSHYTTPSATFPFPGDWQLTIEARRGQFEALTQTISAPIRKS